MKKLFFLLGLCITLNVTAQQPETVYSIAKEWREVSWYKQQQQLWKAEVDKNNKNANAWYNYFSATRALRNCSYDEGKTPEESIKLQIQYQEQCDQIAADVLKAIPNTFEANHINHRNKGFSGDSAFLLKAYEINPNDPRAFEDLMLYYAVNGNREKQEQFAKKLFETNEMPASVLTWSYNLLSELDENAIVLTVGDNDTYAPWIIQATKQFRKDVTVMNTSLIMVDDYRNKLFASVGLSPLKLKMDNDTITPFDDNQQKILQHIFDGKRPVYVAVTGISNFEKKWGDQLFLTGLAYKYSKTTFDNTAIIRRNYEKRYLLDELSESFSWNHADEMGSRFHAMYLPSMVKLYKSYQESEETGKQLALERLLLDISEKSGQQTEVMELIGKKPQR